MPNPFLLATLLLLPTIVSAQPVDSIVRYHYGDDPTGKLGWGRPDFDDTGWAVAQNGHWPLPPMNSNGFLWVRTRMNAPGDTNGALSIRVTNFTDALDEVFVDGHFVGRLGNAPPHAHYGQDGILALPSYAISPGAPVAVALRVWYPPVAHVSVLGPPRDAGVQIDLDQSRNLQSSLRADHATAVVANGLSLMLNVLFMGMGCGLLFFWFQTRRRELLICSALLMGQSLLMVEYGLMTAQLLPISWVTHWVVIIAFSLFCMCLSIEFLWSIYGFRNKLFKNVGQSAALGYIASVTLLCFAKSSQVTSRAAITFLVCLAVFYLIGAGANLWSLFITRRRRAVAAATLLLPITGALMGFGLAHGFTVGPFYVEYFQLALFIAEFTMFLMLSGQAWQAWRAREDLRAEFDAAREVQERLITPAAGIPGFEIESAYAPAKDVGGDFFFVRAGNQGAYQDNRDLSGGAFIVVGDVSGKGLRAALTVSAIMGALRTMPDLEPAQILTALNRGLVGQLGGGFVTCCAMTVSCDGTAILANAGHLQPYRSSAQSPTEEIVLDCGLPLGLTAAADYSESTFLLHPDERITMLTDGVLEARNNKTGELYGFERTAAISTHSAGSIAQAAQAFGQEDDITVLTIHKISTNEATEVVHA